MISFIISALKIIFLLGFLIFIHELGHFTVAKLCKVKVNEFAIGFGPTLWKKQGKETKYALRLVPLGGFVNMQGEEERSDEEGSFSKASIPKRIAIVMAGATVNIIFAIVTYFVLTTTSGPYITNEVAQTIDGFPAQELGIMPGDKIIQVNEKQINNLYDLNNAIQKNNQEIKIKVERNGKIEEYITTPKAEESNGYKLFYLGVNLKPAEDTFINRCINGFINVKDFTFSIVDNMKQLFTGHVGVDQMMGPVGISEVVSKTSGIREFVYMMALISMSLGVTNLLPIPALDGGKILILIIEAIRRKPMNEKTEINIQLIGFSILIALSLYVTYNDVMRTF